MRRATAAADRPEDRFERFFGMNYRLVYAYLNPRFADRSRVDDAVAETFFVAWRRFADVPIDDDIALVWLLRIAHYTCMNAIRAEVRRRALIDRLSGSHVTGSVVGPEDGLERTESRRRIVAALMALPDADRDLLLLATWDGLSGPELAGELACSVGAAWTRLSRARARFRQAYDGALAATEGVA